MPEEGPALLVEVLGADDRPEWDDASVASQHRLRTHFPAAASREPLRRGFRSGDVRHSLADIGKARALLGYEPTHRVAEGLDVAASWYAAAHPSK